MRDRTKYVFFQTTLEKNVVINGVNIKEKHPLGLRKTCRMLRNVVIYDVVISEVKCMAKIGNLPGPTKIFRMYTEMHFICKLYNVGMKFRSIPLLY